MQERQRRGKKDFSLFIELRCSLSPSSLDSRCTVTAFKNVITMLLSGKKKRGEEGNFQIMIEYNSSVKLPYLTNTYFSLVFLKQWQPCQALVLSLLLFFSWTYFT